MYVRGGETAREYDDGNDGNEGSVKLLIQKLHDSTALAVIRTT